MCLLLILLPKSRNLILRLCLEFLVERLPGQSVARGRGCRSSLEGRWRSVGWRIGGRSPCHVSCGLGGCGSRRRSADIDPVNYNKGNVSGLEEFVYRRKRWKLSIGGHVRTFRAISSLFFVSRSFCNGFSAGVSAALLASWAFSLDAAELGSVLAFVASVD